MQSQILILHKRFYLYTNSFETIASIVWKKMI